MSPVSLHAVHHAGCTRTWCFEQVRSVWLPRTAVREAVGCAAAATAAAGLVGHAADHFALRTLAASLAAWIASTGGLHALRQLEDSYLDIPQDVREDRSLLPAATLSVPAAVLCAALCCAARAVGAVFA